jgi:hypothetical protein
MQPEPLEPLADALRAVSLASDLVKALDLSGSLAGQLDALLNDEKAELSGLGTCLEDWRADVRGALWASTTAAQLIEACGPPLNNHDLAKRFLLKNARRT